MRGAFFLGGRGELVLDGFVAKQRSCQAVRGF